MSVWIFAGNRDDLVIAELLTHHQDLLSPSPHPTGWGAQGAGRGQLTPADPRDVPPAVASCSVCKAGGKRRKGGNIQSDGVTITCGRALLSWGWLNSCLPRGNGE